MSTCVAYQVDYAAQVCYAQSMILHPRASPHVAEYYNLNSDRAPCSMFALRGSPSQQNDENDECDD